MSFRICFSSLARLRIAILRPVSQSRRSSARQNAIWVAGIKAQLSQMPRRENQPISPLQPTLLAAAESQERPQAKLEERAFTVSKPDTAS
jgi:hypothetical protein